MSLEPLKHFLIVFDRAAGHQVEMLEFSDADEAVQAYQRLERQHMGEQAIDIVLVGSDSLDTVRVTHANYFRDGSITVANLEEYLTRFAQVNHLPHPAS